MRLPILVLASVVSTTAYAERVGVVVTGEATVQPQLAAHLERWLHDHGRDVVPGPLEPDAISTLIDCFVLEDLGCARGVVDTRSKSKAVVFTRAEMTPNGDGTRDIAITGYWFQKDHDALAERRVCEKCNDDRFRATVDELMHALVHEPPPPLEGAALTPEVESTREGGMRKWLPLGLMVAGGTALVAGGIMIAIDEDIDPVGKQHENIRDTATGGVVLGLVGAAALGAGIYLWHHDKHSAPVAAVSNDGGYVGWVGRF
ncbi:MAG TPA: hypothetical protein VFV99_07990 [Kofleriaceae bacterium]|nr:hypothetical protein [Kofleriaceae bacterium]